jgi:hypothetical protein
LHFFLFNNKKKRKMDNWIAKNVELVKVTQLSFIAFILFIHVAVFVFIAMDSRTEWIWDEWIRGKNRWEMEKLGINLFK